MELNTLNPAECVVGNSKRIGRGPGSGKGKTCGRGQKGAGARKSSHKGRVGFEGGQMPLIQRVPKRGFTPPFPKEVQIVNLSKFKNLEANEIDIAVMVEKGLVRNPKISVKVLGTGDVAKALTIKANAFSASAKAAIEKAGGKAEIV